MTPSDPAGALVNAIAVEQTRLQVLDGEPSTVAVAVARIRSWHDTLRAIAGVAEAQIMAACWAIRRNTPDEESFKATIHRELAGILEPDHALAMAETWDVARRQRELRTLAMDNPGGAIAFVHDFATTVGVEHLRALDEDDREVAELLSAPPRKRRAQLRALVRMRRGADAENPPPAAPVAAASPPEPQSDAAAADTSSWARAEPGPVPEQLITMVKEIEGQLSSIANVMAEASGDPAWTPARLERLARFTDMAMVDLEHIGGFASQDDGAGKDDA